MLLEATIYKFSKMFINLAVIYHFIAFGYAKSIAGIRNEIRATEAASKALEATWRLQCQNIRMIFIL